MTTLSNQVQLIGNVGQQPEIKTFDNGGKIARVSLATNEKRKNATGEYITETTWHNLVFRENTQKLWKSTSKKVRKSW